MPPTEEDIAWFRSTFHPIPRPALPDDCVEYSLYIISPTLNHDDTEVRPRLREVQKAASEIQKKWLKDYIWQRQGFNLELVKEEGQSLLRGRTEYGDSLEDEWVIVWLLRELTIRYLDLWIKITDSDGEFLLVEAAGALPTWLEPEIAENRVWMHTGGLTILKPKNPAKSAKQPKEKLCLQEARKIILEEPKCHLNSSTIQDEAFYRLRNYPTQIKNNMHNTVLRIPRKIAFLLKLKPSYIAPAVESFYLRDPIALKPLQSQHDVEKLVFSLDDLVTVPVRLPRVAYAQLKSQDFPPPAVWQGRLPPKSTGAMYAQAESGMKLASGFEMLVSDPQNQDKQVVREIKMLLDDLETGDEVLPTDKEMEKWDKTEDDESWLDISFEDLEEELGGRGNQSSTRTKEPGKFGDEAAQENLHRMVKQFQEFFNDDQAGHDSADFFSEDSDDDIDNDDNDDDDDGDDIVDDNNEEDKETRFNEDEFTRMMREMMGMPPSVMEELMKGRQASSTATKSLKTGTGVTNTMPGRVEEVDDSDSENGEDMEEIMREMEVELRASGALNLDPGPSTRRPAEARRPSKDKQSTANNGNEENDTSEEDNDEDPDMNLARNLLESFRSQSGMSGPAGSFLGLIGSSVPRDEADYSEKLHVQSK